MDLEIFDAAMTAGMLSNYPSGFSCTTDSSMPAMPDYTFGLPFAIHRATKEKDLEDKLVVCSTCGSLNYLRDLCCHGCGWSLAQAKLLKEEDLQ